MRKKRTLFNPLVKEGFNIIDEGVEGLQLMLEGIGSVRKGINISKNLNDLSFSVSSGNFVFYDGLLDKVIPTASFDGSEITSFRYVQPDGVILPNTETFLNPDQFWDGSTVQTIQQNDWTQQFVLINRETYDVLITIGDEVFTTISNARQRVPFSVYENPTGLIGYELIGAFIYQISSSDGSGEDQLMLRADKFGQIKSLSNSSITVSDNKTRAGRFFSTVDGNESFLFNTPFSTVDGTSNEDIIVVLQRENQDNISAILAPKDITVNGFTVNRDNGIDGVGTSEPFSYIATNLTEYD